MIWTWTAASLAALGAASVLSPTSLSRIDRAGTGGLLILLGAGDAILSDANDGMALIVDGSLGLIGVGLPVVPAVFRECRGRKKLMNERQI